MNSIRQYRGENIKMIFLLTHLISNDQINQQRHSVIPKQI